MGAASDQADVRVVLGSVGSIGPCQAETFRRQNFEPLLDQFFVGVAYRPEVPVKIT